jgi:TetR/AcrR family acrAB operon transcriptional repressor
MRIKNENIRKDNRSKILYAALELFSEKGYAGASIDDIAKKTEMTKGAIYWHFKDKLDLYTAVHDFVFDEYKRTFMKPFIEINDPREKIEHIITKTLQFYRDNPVIISFYSTSLHEGHFALSPKILNKIKEIYEEDRKWISQIIVDGIQQGQFIKIDPKVTASVLVASLDGILMQWIFDKEIDLDLAARGIMLIFFKGIEKRS